MTCKNCWFLHPVNLTPLHENRVTSPKKHLWTDGAVETVAHPCCRRKNASTKQLWPLSLTLVKRSPTLCWEWGCHQYHPRPMPPNKHATLNHGNLRVSVGKFNIFETYQHLGHKCPLWLWSSFSSSKLSLWSDVMWRHIRIQYIRTMLYNSCGRWWPFEYDLAFRMMRPIHSTSWEGLSILQFKRIEAAASELENSLFFNPSSFLNMTFTHDFPFTIRIFVFPTAYCSHFWKATCHPKIAMALPWPSQALKGWRSLEDVDPTSPAEKDLTWPLPRAMDQLVPKKNHQLQGHQQMGI